MQQLTMPTKINNEEYLTAQEAADLLGYSRQWFIEVVAPREHLRVYRWGAKKRGKLYKKAELEPLIGIRPVEDEPGEDGNG